jgi:hypothetical protein
MAFNNIPASSLSRFSVGEIVDLSGVPNFYNAGSSQWLRSATATASSNLSATTKTNLANAGTANAQTVLAQSTLSLSYNSSGLYATYPIARISASSISVVPGSNFTTDVVVGVMTSAGLQAVGTGQVSTRTSQNSGANGVVASNNTKIFSYCFTSATALNVRSTTNGTTWTAETVTGIPVFSTDINTSAHASSSNATENTGACTTGWKRDKTSTTEFAVFFCGARFLIIGPGTGATNHVASLSSDGFTFGGDNTLAVLGSTTLTVAQAIQFYRNGNNCFLQVGPNNKRYSTDGGVTWAASTFAAAVNPNAYMMQYNQSDPAKLVIMGGFSSAEAYYTADSGATWSANRPLPSTDPNGGLYYKGSTLVWSNVSGVYKVSTDNGVTWATPSFPIGTLGSNIIFTADANRFYAGVLGQAQLLTSSDAVTWTLITLSQNFQIGTVTTQTGNGIITYPGDSNTVVLLGYNTSSGFNQCIFSLDGGVTWTCSQFTVGNIGSTWGVGNAFSTPDAGGVGFAFGMDGITAGQNTNVFKTDITGGGAFYRTGSSTIAPTRTNAIAYVRVG